MTPVINPWVFYAVSVCDALKCVAGIGAGICAVALFMFWLDDCFDKPKFATPLFCVMLAIAILTPPSKTVEKMVLAQNVTYERVEVATDAVKTVYEDITELFDKDE
jgi:hypothetical protein